MNEQPNHSLQADAEVDARGMACPIPLLKARLEIKRLEVGQVLLVISTDAGTRRDFRSFASTANHELVLEEEESGVYRFWLRIGDSKPLERETAVFRL